MSAAHTPTPTYFVRHPDGSYSVARPQPLCTVGFCNCDSKREGLHAFDCPCATRPAAENDRKLDAHDELVAALRDAADALKNANYRCLSPLPQEQRARAILAKLEA